MPKNKLILKQDTNFEEVIELQLNEEEMQLVHASAKAVREVMDILDNKKLLKNTRS